MTSGSNETQTKTRQFLQSLGASKKEIALVIDGDVASAVLAHLVAEQNVPLAAVVHLDNGFDFPQSKKVVDALAEKLPIQLTAEPVPLGPGGACCGANKKDALAVWAAKNGIEVLLLPTAASFAGSSDYRQLDSSAGASASGGSFSFDRVYPLFEWSESSLFAFSREKNLSVNPLYLSRNGKRFSRIGCQACSKPVDSQAETLEKVIAEVSSASAASGAAPVSTAPKSDAVMDRLRALGYL